MGERLDEKQIRVAIDEAIRIYDGYIPTLETAIGALFLGKALGWEVLLLVHNRSTLKNFEKILKIPFRDQMDLSTPLSRKHIVWVWTQKFENFWKVVKGEIKVKGRTEARKEPMSDVEYVRLKMDIG